MNFLSPRIPRFFDLLLLVTVSLLLLLSLTQCGSRSLVQPEPTVAPQGETITPQPSFLPIVVVAGTATDVANREPIATSTATPTTTPTATPTLQPTASPTPLCPCGIDCRCQVEHVVIISIDGLRPDALVEAETPIIDGLRALGAYTDQAETVYPSVTLISHASMLGGMAPNKHGIDWNNPDPMQGKINGPTLFTEMKAAGLRTAMVVGKPKLDHLVLNESVDQYIYAGFTDRQVTTAAVELIHTAMPDLLFIHLPDVDSAGHAMGWMSNTQLLTINWTDTLIGEIIAALNERSKLEKSIIILTSDHGGSDFSHGEDKPADMLIPWLILGPGIPQNGTITQEVVTYDTAATVLHIFQVPRPLEWDGSSITEGFSW